MPITKMPGHTRRAILAALASLAFPPIARAHTADPSQWASFKTRFVQPNGRVLDTGNGGQSHTEGQGWGMLFAQRFDDRDSFHAIHGWTERVLRRPTDRLHAWRCRPGDTEIVDDLNNASDGDITIAWALLEAGQRWGDRQLTEAGTHLALDIQRLLMRRVGSRIVLLPGLRGFEHADYAVINLSYYVFPALPVLAAACPDPAWLQLAAHGLGLLRAARFGQWQLPADWVAVPSDSGLVFPAPGWPARFSYDAVRVPLYMAWAGLEAETAVIDALRWWSDPRRRMLPAWVDVATGATANYTAPVGMAAIADLAISAAGTGRPKALPPVSAAPDYYSAALTLLAHLAWADIGLATA